MTDFAPSRYQQAIFDFVSDEQAGNAIIEAVAGSGKTTTIVKALEMIPGNQHMFCSLPSTGQSPRSSKPASRSTSRPARSTAWDMALA